MDVLNSMGTIASSTAKSAVNGTQYLYTNLVTKNTTSSSVTNSNVGVGATSSGGVGGGGMGEMDYQRESLLLDPHDLEQSQMTMNTTTTTTTTTQQQQQQQQ